MVCYNDHVHVHIMFNEILGYLKKNEKFNDIERMILKVAACWHQAFLGLRPRSILGSLLVRKMMDWPYWYSSLMVTQNFI